jgi:ribose-phosphate pyrophosphokinase
MRSSVAASPANTPPAPAVPRHEFTVLAGTANPPLAAAVARELRRPLGDCHVERFPDGELSVQLDETVRGREVFVVQPTSPPVNDHLIELLAFADACRRAAAARFTAVVPYFGYARSDRRDCRRQPIAASLVASLMERAGVDHVITVDLHASQVEGFFHIPVDSLTAVPLMCDALRDLPLGRELAVVSPDAGRVQMATEYAAYFGAPMAVLHKKRESGTKTHVTHLVGDVSGRTCLIVDDMIATGGTLLESLHVLRDAGARAECCVAATHGLLLDDAADRLASEGVREVLITDTVAQNDERHRVVRVVSAAPLIAAAIRRLLADESLGDLY